MFHPRANINATGKLVLKFNFKLKKDIGMILRLAFINFSSVPFHTDNELLRKGFYIK